MDVIFVFILSIKFFSLVQSADDIPCVWCGFGGTSMTTGYKYSMSDIPKRCEAIIYSNQFFNIEPSEEDAAAIAGLIAANKIVYIIYSGMNLDNWGAIISSNNQKTLDKIIEPMVKFLNKSKASGVLLSYLQLLGGDIPDYATKIHWLICTIKASVSNIKVALLVSGWMANDYKNKKLFDFTVVNDIVDLYFIDTTMAEENCTATTTKDGGRLRINSTEKGVVSLETINSATKSSPMCQDKIIIYFGDYVMKIEDGHQKGSTYSAYCKRTDKDIWCPDTMQMFYDRVKLIKGNFKGILVDGLDEDDFDNSCGCGKFSVANTYIDAWEDKPITCCPKI